MADRIIKGGIGIKLKIKVIDEFEKISLRLKFKEAKRLRDQLREIPSPTGEIKKLLALLEELL